MESTIPPEGDAHCVDKDRRLNRRLCWPTQDRARAESPSKAPRTSSALTASVLFGSPGSVSGPCRSYLPGSFTPLSRTAWSKSWLGGRGLGKVCCGCCKIGLPGQSRPFRKRLPKVQRHLQVPPMAITDGSLCEKGGVASDCSSTKRPGFGRDDGSAEENLPEPDWRILGAQDVSDLFS